jgi:hypothetical protein
MKCHRFGPFSLRRYAAFVPPTLSGAIVIGQTLSHDPYPMTLWTLSLRLDARLPGTASFTTAMTTTAMASPGNLHEKT